MRFNIKGILAVTMVVAMLFAKPGVAPMTVATMVFLFLASYLRRTGRRTTLVAITFITVLGCAVSLIESSSIGIIPPHRTLDWTTELGDHHYGFAEYSYRKLVRQIAAKDGVALPDMNSVYVPNLRSSFVYLGALGTYSLLDSAIYSATLFSWLGICVGSVWIRHCRRRTEEDLTPMGRAASK